MASAGSSFGGFTFTFPIINDVNARPFEKMVEEWMVRRLLPYADLYDQITNSWTEENKPEWKGPVKISGGVGQNEIVVALLTLSVPFVWLDEGDEGDPVPRKVRIEPAVGATAARKFGRVGESKKVKRDKDGKKQFLPRNRKATITPRYWSRELIRREEKKLQESRAYFSTSKVTPGILYQFGQVALSPKVTKEFSRGLGYKLRKRTIRF